MDMASSSPSSSSKKRETRGLRMHSTGFVLLNEDLVQNILKRLPALSFASAACVSKSWNQVCNRILSRPKLASAISLNPDSDIAVQEVLDKVLSEPIRPHFAIASVSGGFGFEKTLQFFAKKLGSRTPIVLSLASGIIGRDALTDEFREVMWQDAYKDCSTDDCNDEEHIHTDSGIILTIGFVPGLKVDVFPLLRPTKASQMATIDNFVMDIRNYAASLSGCTSPLLIIMFGDEGIDLRPIIEKLDYAMSMETIIVGDERTQFSYRSGIESRNICGRSKYSSDAVALVFARDRDKPCGEIQFHATLSNGVSTVGTRYKAVSVRVNGPDHATWLTARREGQQEILDGQRLLSDIHDELENRIECPDLYIGVTKRRKYFIGSEKPRLITSLAFHAVVGGDEEYLFVDGTGIKTGDYFQFYHSDPSTALSSCGNVSVNLRNLKTDGSENGLHTGGVGGKEFLGGFIFSCSGRGEPFFGRRNVDSSPFSENFPGVPLAGIFCGGEIGRGLSILNAHQGQGQGREESSIRCCLRVYSTVYLVVSYAPASVE